MVTFYIQNKRLYLVDKLTAEIEDYLHRPETIFIDELNTPAIKTMLEQLERPEYYTGVFLHPDITTLVDSFKENLTVLPAAGGMVYTPEHEILLIHRLGKWDLPKGKLDEGESLEECALREIGEETGAKSLSIERSLGITYHTYQQKNKRMLKESHWYLVKAAEKTILKPQTEENIEQCLWVPLKELNPFIDGSFPSVATVLQAGVKLLQEVK